MQLSNNLSNSNEEMSLDCSDGEEGCVVEDEEDPDSVEGLWNFLFKRKYSANSLRPIDWKMPFFDSQG